MFNWVSSIFHTLSSGIVTAVIAVGIFVHPTHKEFQAPIIPQQVEVIQGTTSQDITQVQASSTESEVAKLVADLKREKDARIALQAQISSDKKTESLNSKTVVTPPSVAQPAATQTLTTKQIAALVEPSVVLITTPSGSASGVVINNGRYILTNQHVVGSYAFVQVKLQSGVSFKAAVLGSNAKVDLAIISTGLNNPPAVTLGSSDDSSLNIGDDAYALGYALGFTNITFTKGTISARQTISSLYPTELLQTDAAINHGNSGGPLVNDKGEVIGINTFTDASIYTQTQGVYFAIPIDTAKSYIPMLSGYGTSFYDVNPLGSTKYVPRSVYDRVSINPNSSCDTLAFLEDQIAICKMYKTYPKDFVWYIDETK